MNYEDIPVKDLRELRRLARRERKEIFWRQLAGGIMAAALSVVILSSLGRAFHWPEFITYASIGFFGSALMMGFHAIAVEPLMRKEIERIATEQENTRSGTGS